MNTSYQITNNPFFGNQSAFFSNGLKSAEQKLERQETRDNQVAFFEKQKGNLKNMECDTLEAIAEKLKMFHSYEEQIKSVKQEYNNQQMMHVMDEILERAEKIAEAAEKTKPKTEEERREELVEEAVEETLGTDESEEGLKEVLEEVAELAEELEENVEVSQEELTEAIEKKVEERIKVEELAEKTAETSEEKQTETIKIKEQAAYSRIDIFI